jgi:pyruvate ferredoxin oxidoreductase gamma subunit
VCTIDAKSLSLKHLGRYFPNSPMLAAVVEVSHCVDPDQFLKDMETSYRHKFATKPQVVQGNLDCLAESMKEVRG